MEPFLGEIRLFPFGFTPTGWTACEGQILPIQTNNALFSLLGTQFGGDGRVNFGLPDLRGRTPLASNYTTYLQGAKGGEATHALTITEMPAHTHGVIGSLTAVVENSPVGNTWGSFAGAFNPTSNVTMNPAAIGIAGAGVPHANMQPYLALNFCIATSGIYPPRN